MAGEKIFTDGMIFKRPHANAPDFVKGKLSIRVDEFVEFAQKHAKAGWLNINLAESRAGKYYAEVDTWVPDKKNASLPSSDSPSMAAQTPPTDDFDDKIPF